jgi:glucokinase
VIAQPTLAVGIDIGGSKTAVGLVDVAHGVVAERRVIDTPARENTGRLFIKDLAGVAEDICKPHFPHGLSNVSAGIGICELVEPAGRIVSAHRVLLDEREIRLAFTKFGTVVLEADVRAAAMAEARFGLGQGLAHWIYVNAGTGVSSVLMNGQACYTGAHGWGLGLGMSPSSLRNGGLARPALIEDVAGGAGLVKMARERDFPGGSARDLIALADSGCREAIELVEKGGRALGGAIAFLVNVLDPQAVLVGGGLVSSEGPYWKALVSSAALHIWHTPAKATPIRRATLHTDAGFIGAALVTLAAC